MELQTYTSWEINNEELRELYTLKDDLPKALEKLENMGGLEALSKKLKISLTEGIPKDDDKQERSTQFGTSVIPEPPGKNFFFFMWQAFQDPILMLLAIFSVISIIANVVVPPEGQENTAWLEGVAIMAAVLIVLLVSAFNDYAKDKKFRALNKVKNDRQIKVIRGGKDDKIESGQLLVGDIVILASGDHIPGDGLYVSGHAARASEASMTGESKAVKKGPDAPFMLSGTQLSEGNMTMLVTAVGMQSEWGIVYSKLKPSDEATPLQENLKSLAKLVGLVGTVVAVILFIILLIYYIIDSANDDDWEPESLTLIIQYIITGITIIVVAVPEGLPLAVTISLAYSMKSMLKDNILVRHLSACETMGGATNICSDKTGTLTENKMTATSVWISGNKFDDDLPTKIPEKISETVLDAFCENICVNSKGFLRKLENNKIEFVGNSTECSLLVMADTLGYNYVQMRKEVEVLQLWPFASSRKRMSTLVPLGDSKSRLHVKGAPDIMLPLFVKYMDEKGQVHDITEEKKKEFNDVITEMASQGLRTIGVGFRDFDARSVEEEDPEHDITLIGVVGIQDPLRPEVSEAIKLCKKAGVVVRMVTGDNYLTATKIARDCGILEEGCTVIEGPDFRKLSDEEIDELLPKLRVLARSSPSDKHKLVMRLKAHKEVVAVTGDGTNDGPALKAADVGMAMGIAGTEIAKEASDIIIMDDNFASIVKAVMWGRNVRQSIQKFIQFQITINFVALTIAVIAAASELGEPLRPIQLLWVNLIQDTLAALALATDKPTEKLLMQKPAGRNERIISPIMWRNILTTAVFQNVLLLTILYAGDKMFGLNEDVDLARDRSVQYTILFNTFVFLQLFNEINARLLTNEWNVFDHFFSNWITITILFITSVLQVFIVEFGGEAMGTVPLNAMQWLYSFGFGSSMLLYALIVRLISPYIHLPESFIKWLAFRRPPKAGEESEEDDKTALTTPPPEEEPSSK